MSWFGDTTSWGWVVMTIGMLAFWGLLLTGVAALVHFSSGTRQATQQQPSTAEQLLAERFARGDIDESDYSKRLATLREQRRT